MRHIVPLAMTALLLVGAVEIVVAQSGEKDMPLGEYRVVTKFVSFEGADPEKNVRREPALGTECLGNGFKSFLKKKFPNNLCKSLSGPTFGGRGGTAKYSCKKSNKEVKISSDVDVVWWNSGYFSITTKASVKGETEGVGQSITEGVFVYSTENSRRCNGRND